MANELSNANIAYANVGPVTMQTTQTIKTVKQIVAIRFHARRAYPFNQWVRLSAAIVTAEINNMWSIIFLFLLSYRVRPRPFPPS